MSGVSKEAPSNYGETLYGSAKVELIDAWPENYKETQTKEFKTSTDLPKPPSDQIPFGGALENDPNMPATDQSARPVATTSYEEVRHPQGDVEGMPKLFQKNADAPLGEQGKRVQQS